MNEIWLELVFPYGWAAALIVIAYFTGSWIERRHFRQIIKREDELRDILAFAIRRAPADLSLSEPKLVTGSAVISVDYFKMFAAALRRIVGGRLGAYESLYERARREAIVRMKDEAKRQGGSIVLNVKLESARIYAGGRRSTVSVESLAYGTAYRQSDAGAEVH